MQTKIIYKGLLSDIGDKNIMLEILTSEESKSYKNKYLIQNDKNNG